MEEADVEEGGGAVGGRNEPGKDQAGDEAGAVDGVGQDADAKIGDGEDDDDAEKTSHLKVSGVRPKLR